MIGAMTITRIDVRAHLDGSIRLVSRGEAKALISALPRDGTVELDFAGIEGIGPSFADELFRVFANAHPAVVLAPIHANEAIARMLRRAQASRTSAANQG